jgi:hypothetical protein
MTAMHHEPVADRLGVPTHQLPAGWRNAGGGGGGMSGGGGGTSRTGCLSALLIVALASGATAAGQLTATIVTHLTGA